MSNYAYIDGANLHKSLELFGWEFDYGRFRVLLEDKYLVEKAYLFVGYVDDNKYLYKSLEKQGFELVYKETNKTKSGTIKGNCDVELAWQLATDYALNAFDRSVIVTGDGDFAQIALKLARGNKLLAVLAPHPNRSSYLLRKRQEILKLTYLSEMRHKLEKKEETPD